jgi:hypothetical protein
MGNHSNLNYKMSNSNARLSIEETSLKESLLAQEHTGQYTEYSIIVMNLKSVTIQKLQDLCIMGLRKCFCSDSWLRGE